MDHHQPLRQMLGLQAEDIGHSLVHGIAAGVVTDGNAQACGQWRPDCRYGCRRHHRTRERSRHSADGSVVGSYLCATGGGQVTSMASALPDRDSGATNGGWRPLWAPRGYTTSSGTVGGADSNGQTVQCRGSAWRRRRPMAWARGGATEMGKNRSRELGSGCCFFFFLCSFLSLFS
jgi:hypothetical protein